MSTHERNHTAEARRIYDSVHNKGVSIKVFIKDGRKIGHLISNCNSTRNGVYVRTLVSLWWGDKHIDFTHSSGGLGMDFRAYNISAIANCFAFRYQLDDMFGTNTCEDWDYKHHIWDKDIPELLKLCGVETVHVI